MVSITQNITKVNKLLPHVSNIYSNLCNMTFVQWIETELNKRNWNRSELARRSGLSTAALSHIYSGVRNPGSVLCKAIAKAFNLPETVVFIAAGLLPPERKDEPSFDELKYYYSQMNPDEQEEFLAIGRLKVERKIPPGKRGNNR